MRPVARARATPGASGATASSSRAAWARRAAGVRADSSSGAAGSSGSSGAAGSASSSGAASRIRCALVPLIPNEDTAARRGRPVAGQARVPSSSSTLPADQSTCGEGASRCSVPGSSPYRSACTSLITPVTPAAAWVCPRLDFDEPSRTGASPGPRCP